MNILETERLILREIVERDAEFIFNLLNQPSFIKYIGNRSVHSIEVAREFIESRYRQSYREHGFGLYTVELKENNMPIGICGFVKRETLPEADIGFAFLPQFERKGFAFESADAVLKYGRDVLGLKRVLAITTIDNESSGRLLAKLGFKFERLIKQPPSEEELKLFSSDT
ncbi:MAG TPA: GNAT family N-acetyltransferase [Pyrinomonadaceae bacterium]|jgi:RimJ/RimL family protein N-acetyltransferase